MKLIYCIFSKELEATINRTEIDIAKKENSTKHYETETQAIHKRLQILSGNEKLFFSWDVILAIKLNL